ncbi:TetR/AcrR family transcriptional regulator [Streptosporangium sp. KLBMP 9127]|nr:TetR family transcriptional regulator [Streptosporangium sp. KLBMP 9127]
MRPDSSPVGRKRNPIIEAARRAQIIDATIETVATLGYAQTSLARIAERAQTSKSVISYHFTSRDDLLEQVVTQIYDDAWAAIAPRLEAATGGPAKLRAYIESNLTYLKSHRSRLLAVADITGSHRAPDGTPRFETVGEQTGIGVLTGILRQGQNEGDFRAFDPRIVALTVSQALVGVLGQWALDPATDLDACAAELVTLFDLATRSTP